MRFSVLVETRPLPGVADPEGATIERSLPALGFDGVSQVRVGKAFRFWLEAPDLEAAQAEVGDMCRRFLTNPVIEDAEVTVTPQADQTDQTDQADRYAGSGTAEAVDVR